MSCSHVTSMLHFGGHHNSAVPCGPGTYYSTAGPRARCLPCSKDTYQDEHKSTSCKPCPGETFTKSQGSKSVEACLRKYMIKCTPKVDAVCTYINLHIYVMYV